MNKNVENYMQNQILKTYLSSSSASREIISKWEQIVQLGIVNIDMSEALTTTR